MEDGQVEFEVAWSEAADRWYVVERRQTGDVTRLTILHGDYESLEDAENAAATFLVQQP